jgi:superfamily I DNA/RNA helicase
VLVDEVQDLSPLQLALVKALMPKDGKGFFAIGDPEQSIYGFRGAHGRCREFFAAAWPDLRIIRLARNYRSLGGILRLSHAALGEQASGGALLPTRAGAAHISLFSAPGADAEAMWVAERVSALIGLGSHTLADAARARDKGVAQAQGEGEHSPGDIAILLRTHSLAGVYRKALSGIGAPVAEPAADAFWVDERVSMILYEAGRMLGICVAGMSPDNRQSAPACPDKVLTRGPMAVAAYLTSSPPFDLAFWTSTPFRELVKAYDRHKSWQALLSWISLRNELELVRGKAEKVQIISLHASKGLEFRSVFMPALEDGLLPFAGPGFLAGKSLEKLGMEHYAEEQRLLYVGLTRARDNLFLSTAKKRMLYGRPVRLQPSRFLRLLPREEMQCSALKAKTERQERQLTRQ